MNISNLVNDKKLISIVFVVVIVVGGVAFYGGMKYMSGGNLGSGLNSADFQNIRNLSPEQRQQRFQNIGMNGDTRGGRTGQGGATLSGEIISKDDKSITIKLGSGGSKIAFVTSSTIVMKSMTGSLDDLVAGEQVIVSGNSNSDGSVMVRSVQLKPVVPQ